MLPELVRADDHEVSTAASHPEEMKASFRIQVGEFFSLDANARTTPAGIVAVAILVGAAVASSILALRLSRNAQP